MLSQGFSIMINQHLACDMQRVPFGEVQEEKVSMDGLPMKPATLAGMIALIENGTISGKMGKDLLPDLLKGEGVCGGASLAAAGACGC
jgi:Asp-tRNA(Asn)/Glu-tRNA(Gln) amidotransferase B subunit